MKKMNTIVMPPKYCRACGASLRGAKITHLNGFVQDMLFECVTCQTCGTMQTGKGTDEDLAKTYDTIYRHANIISGYKRYEKYRDLSKSILTKWLFNIFYAEELYYGAFLLVRDIEKERRQKLMILEIGCGLGYFTAKLRTLGHNVIGCDFSSDACERATLTYGGEYICSDVKQVLLTHGNAFDVIVGLEVIEHVEDPVEFLRSIKSLLKPNGSIILSTPNLRTNNIWNGTEPPIHLSYFSLDGVRTMGLRVGAEVTIIDFGKKDMSASINIALPGSVLTKDMKPNLRYFDNGLISMASTIRIFIRNIYNRFRFRRLNPKRLFNQNSTSSLGQVTTIVRLRFDGANTLQ
jgi:SAM-dependent methyltransferase